MNNQSITITLNCYQQSYAVLALEGQQAVSTGLVLELVVATDSLPVNASVVVTIFNQGVIAQQFEGIIAQQTIKEMFGQIISEVRVVSRWQQLIHQRQAMLYNQQSVPKVAKTLLKKIGYSEAQIVERLIEQYPEHEHIVQTTQETEKEFLQRLLAEAGLFLLTEFDASLQQELIILADSNNAFLRREQLYTVAASDHSSHYIYDLTLSAQQTVDAVLMQSRGENQPQQILTAQAKVANKTKAKITKTYFGKINQDYQQLEQDAKIYAQAAQQGSCVITAKSKLASLRVGQTIDLMADDLASSYSGQYLLVSIEHYVKQIQAMTLHGDNQSYYNIMHLIPATQVYRSAIVAKENLPMAFMGRVAGVDSYANLDTLGRQMIVPDYINSTSSQPLHRLQPMTGPAEKNFGINFPIADNAEVVFSAINGDNDNLIMLSSLPNAKQYSPVTKINAQHNIFRSYAGNELNLVDDFKNSQINLQTPQGQNKLQLDCTNKQIDLCSDQGSVTIQAGNSLNYASGTATHECHGADRQQIINTKHEVNVARDFTLHANNNIELLSLESIKQQADRNLTITSDANLLLNCQQQTNFSTQHGEVEIIIEKGHVIITANTDLTLSGQGKGDIQISNGNNGLRITANGAIDIYAQELLLNASEAIVLQGKVNYKHG